MNNRIEELAKKAGFCFWADESWKPEGATIDWSCNYDDQLQRFAELIVTECLEVILSSDPSPKMSVVEPYLSIMGNVKEHFYGDGADGPFENENEFTYGFDVFDVVATQLINNIGKTRND